VQKTVASVTVVTEQNSVITVLVTEQPVVTSELTVVHEVVTVFVWQETAVMVAVCSLQLGEDDEAEVEADGFGSSGSAGGSG
jgi:hypothetical protein